MAHLIILRGAPGTGKTTVARRFAGAYTNWEIVEVDHVKLRRHRTTERSLPSDFRIAGEAARDHLAAGRNVIGVEFFNRKELLSAFVTASGRKIASQDVTPIQLHCEVEGAVARKAGVLNEAVVRRSHAAASTPLIGETQIDTSAGSVDEIVRRIAEALEARGLGLQPFPVLDHEPLSREFGDAMMGLYVRARDEADYNATRYLTMLTEHGGIETARLLLNSNRGADGYTALWERGRLDLSVEALVFDNPRFHPLFSEDVIDAARVRLAQYRYPPAT